MSLRPICRIGDHCEGTCRAAAPGHPRSFIGTWLTGSGNMFDNTIPVVRIGDTGLTDCNHVIEATTGSSIGNNDGIPVHRVTDQVIVREGGEGVSTTGSAVWSCED